MAKAKRTQSAIGSFGSVVIALGLILGFINSSIYIAASGVAAGIFILLIGCLADRLDIIIDLLQQVIEHQPDLPEERVENTESSKQS